MSRENLKVLTIGNSFTDSLALYFKDVAESVPGCTLHFERANHGGCELHRHWSYIQNEEKDGVYKMYQDRRLSMREVLTKEVWDVVTIQQGSHLSWRAESYQPFASNIYNYVGKHAPQAEVMIQQTWAYREDDPRIRPGGEWKYDDAALARWKELGATVEPGPWHISQADMYNALTAAYTKVAKELNLRIIPTGFAVQLARKKQPYHFQNYDPELMNTLHWPDLPPQAGDLVGSIRWTKDKTTGELKLGRDTIHLNARGQYLQACVWFAALYGHKTSEITFVPDEIADSDAEFLRTIAQEAVDTFPQVKL